MKKNKPILIAQNCLVESAGTIIDWLQQQDLSFSVVHTYKDELLPGVEEIEAVINLGCPHPVYNYFQYDYLKRLYAFVADVVRTGKPYLGICFGGQMLAHVLGARVLPNKVKEIGTYTVTLTEAGKSDPLFANFAEASQVFHWHGDTFQVPFNSDLLVEGEDCNNQAFRKGRAVSLQFHLEATTDDVTLWCDTYRNEADSVNKTQQDIVAEYLKAADHARSLNFILLENFFNL